MTRHELANAVQNMDWEFSEADTQYLTHNIHRYSGKFIPQIAGRAIELLTGPGDTVLDSYMGSGTTLLEAMLRSRHSIGVDLNPLALLISKVKTTKTEDAELSEIYSELIPFLSALSSDGQTCLLLQPHSEEKIAASINGNQWRIDDPWNRKWYQPDVLRQLVDIYGCIEAIQNEKARNIALVAFSDILRKSSNASSRYPNVMLDKNAKKKALPAKSYREALNHAVASVRAMTAAARDVSASVEMYLQNNLQLSLEDESVDAIISHPPYIAAIPYAEYGSLSLTWLGYDCKKLDGELTGGRRHSSKVISRFEDDYQQYFTESYRVLKPGKFLFLMVGNPVAHGEKVDLDQLTAAYARQAGFEPAATAVRHGQNRRGNKMGDEYLMFFQKNP